jgi:hypothetical protein
MAEGATARAIAWLSTWDSHGVHRTATAGDEAGADWLTGEVARLGAAPTAELYALDCLDPVVSYLECGGESIPGVPVFDAPAISADGIAGTLGRDVAVVELSPVASMTRPPRKCGARRRSGGPDRAKDAPTAAASKWLVCAARHHLMAGTLAEEFAQVRWQSRRE